MSSGEYDTMDAGLEQAWEGPLTTHTFRGPNGELIDVDVASFNPETWPDRPESKSPDWLAVPIEVGLGPLKYRFIRAVRLLVSGAARGPGAADEAPHGPSGHPA